MKRVSFLTVAIAFIIGVVGFPNVSSASTSTNYMTKSEVIEAMKSVDQHARDWDKYMNNDVSNTVIESALTGVTDSKLVGKLGTAMDETISHYGNKKAAWWRESAKKVLNGDINGVKITAEVEPSGNYVKTKRTVTRY